METWHRTGSEPLIWHQPKRFKRFFTLEAGDARYGTLYWEKPWGFTARASTTDGQWEFDHKGFLQSRIPVRDGGSKAEVGLFLTRRYGGLLTLSEKESYLWKLNGMLRAESTWVTMQGIPLLRCTPRHWSTTKASLVLAPEALTLPDLPLLVVLDWYIRLMMFAFAGTVML
jgi:hypothetical protein